MSPWTETSVMGTGNGEREQEVDWQALVMMGEGDAGVKTGTQIVNLNNGIINSGTICWEKQKGSGRLRMKVMSLVLAICISNAQRTSRWSHAEGSRAHRNGQIKRLIMTWPQIQKQCAFIVHQKCQRKQDLGIDPHSSLHYNLMRHFEQETLSFWLIVFCFVEKLEDCLKPLFPFCSHMLWFPVIYLKYLKVYYIQVTMLELTPLLLLTENQIHNNKESAAGRVW